MCRGGAFRLLLGALLPLLLLAGWLLTGQGKVHLLAGSTMGTRWSVQFPTPPTSLSPGELATRVQTELDRLDRHIFSTWTPDSELSRFNQFPPREDFPASAELIGVVLLAQEIHRLTEGAFDMTVGPLVDLWGFGAAPPPAGLPRQADIDAARARLGSEAVTADPARGVLRKERPVRIDLSGIAKGYAADQVAALLEANGLRNYLVEIGGEIRSRGGKGGGEPWTLAVESPAGGARQAQRLLTLPPASLAIAGAGDYRNFFLHDGRRYSHEIDPRSGRPAAHALAAVTVLDASAARADALATALMVLGPEAGRKMTNGRKSSDHPTELSRPSGLEIPAYLIMRGDEGYSAVENAAFTRYLQAGAPASAQ